jgi:cyclopropane fatty-acyl-phospholipid synthase-like methyltransferase
MTHRQVNNCPLCDSTNFKQWCKVSDDGFVTVQCNICELIYVQNPYDKESLKAFYSRYYSEIHQENVVLNAQRELMYELELNFLRNFKKSGSVLDVGCSGGQFLDQFSKFGYDCQGVEFGIEAAKVAKERFQIHIGEFPEMEFEKKYDIIVFRGVIEHVDIPKNYLNKAISLLNKDGVIFITATQNRASLTCNLFREDWNMHYPYEHLYHYAVKDFVKYFGDRGLKSYSENNFYLETPYANPKEDLKLVLQKMNNPEEKITCPPFFDNMMTAVFQF